MAEEAKGSNIVRLAVGASLIAVAAVSVAAFVPRRRWALMAEPFRGAMETPLVAALTLWVASLWAEPVPRAPVFDDMRPFDEF